MMASDLEAYRTGDKPFDFKNTNGFFTTIDMNANDVATPHAAGPRISSHQRDLIFPG